PAGSGLPAAQSRRRLRAYREARDSSQCDATNRIASSRLAPWRSPDSIQNPGCKEGAKVRSFCGLLRGIGIYGLRIPTMLDIDSGDVGHPPERSDAGVGSILTQVANISQQREPEKTAATSSPFSSSCATW